MMVPPTARPYSAWYALVSIFTSAIVPRVGAVCIVLLEPESMLVTPSTVMFFWFSRAPLI